MKNEILNALKNLMNAVNDTAGVYGPKTTMTFLCNAFLFYQFNGNNPDASCHDSECMFVSLIDGVVKANDTQKLTDAKLALIEAKSFLGWLKGDDIWNQPKLLKLINTIDHLTEYETI